MCLYPRIIKNPKYCENGKNGGLIPAISDTRVLYVPIKCGKCLECTRKYAREWQIRLLEDIKYNTNGKFVTFTLSDESIKNLSGEIKGLEGYSLDNEIATLATRRFLERYRKKYTKSLRHWFVTELGHQGTENIHIHGIIWTDKNLEEIEEIWSYGYMWKGERIKIKNKIVGYKNYVNGKTVSYITKYITKKDEIHRTYQSKVLTSPGIGEDYTRGHDSKKNIYNGTNTKESYKTGTGHNIAMPIYWRNKIYSEKEREQLWIQKLDKEERYICGEKIDISKTEKGYWDLLKYHRKRAQELGYGNDDKNWDEIEYEKQRRIIMTNTRIEKAKKKEEKQKNKLMQQWENDYMQQWDGSDGQKKQ